MEPAHKLRGQADPFTSAETWRGTCATTRVRGWKVGCEFLVYKQRKKRRDLESSSFSKKEDTPGLTHDVY